MLIALSLTFTLAPRLMGETATTQWIQKYNYCPTCVQQINEPQGMGIDKNQNVYVGGYSQQVDNDMNWAVVKYSSTGSFLWEARFGGAAGVNDYLYDMKVDSNTGDVYATGNSIENGPYPVYTTVKYNRYGVQQWVTHYNSFAATAWAIAIDSQGNSYVTGNSSESNTLIATIKYDSSGVQQWVAKYDLGGSQSGRGIAVDGFGNVYVAGYTYLAGDPYAHSVTIKYNSQGAEQWHQVYGGNSSLAALVLDPSGNVYVTGSSLAGYSSHGYLTIKYNTTGSQSWASTYEGLGNGADDARAIVYDPSSDTVAVTGGSYDTSNTSSYVTIKYDAGSGGGIWTAHYVGLGHFGGGNGITVDTAGSIYVTGGSIEGGIAYDYATVKYSRNGVQRWAVSYDGGFGSDYGYFVLVGSSGKVYVTGASQNASGDADYATIGYSQN
ncbi:MAG: SBBP repeat-containing protein [Candidatus Acidiferrum sp.]